MKTALHETQWEDFSVRQMSSSGRSNFVLVRFSWFSGFAVFGGGRGRYVLESLVERVVAYCQRLPDGERTVYLHADSLMKASGAAKVRLYLLRYSVQAVRYPFLSTWGSRPHGYLRYSTLPVLCETYPLHPLAYFYS